MIQRNEYYLKKSGLIYSSDEKLKHIDSKAIHCVVLAVFFAFWQNCRGMGNALTRERGIWCEDARLVLKVERLI